MKFVARLATPSDSLTLLTWRNDPLTLDQSRDSKNVTQETHQEWLAEVIQDLSRYLFIIEADQQSLVGTVRFEKRPDSDYEVSITVNPQYRGRRLGLPILLCAEELICTMTTINTLSAYVKKDNLASIALFESAGYTPVQDFWWVKRLEHND